MEPGARYQASAGQTPSSSRWPTLGLQPSLPTGAGHSLGNKALELSSLAPTSHLPLWPLGCWLGREVGCVDGGALTRQAPQDLQVCSKTLYTKQQETQTLGPETEHLKQFEGKKLFRPISRHLRAQRENRSHLFRHH